MLLPLAALAGGCLFLQWLGLPGGAAPLAALAAAVLVLFGAGILGVLPLAAALLYVLGLGLGAWTLYRRRKAAAPAGCGAAGAVFWCGALALLVLLARVQPCMTQFDEYSFWGTAARLTCLNGRLYTECEIGTPWQITQMPAVPLLGYFVQRCGAYADWKLIWAVDLLLLAGAAAVAECAAAGGWRLQIPAALAALLTPFVLVLRSHTSVLATPYLEAMGDTVAGVLFGGAAAFWWAVRARCPRLWWLMLPVACLAGNIKDNTFVLGLAVAGLAAADWLLLGLKDEAGRLTARSLAGRCGGALALVAAPAAQYLAWNRYVAALVAQNAAEGGMGATSQPLGAVLMQGIRLLLGLPAAAYYEARRETAFAYAHTLWDWFFHHKISLLGSGAAITAVILLLFAGAVALAPTLRGKLRAALAALASTVCFGGYWLMLLLSYAFILKDSSPAYPVSYERYYQSYYLGWFLLALAVFAASAAGVRRPFGRAAGHAGALALAAVFCGQCFVNLEPQYTVFGVTQAQYAQQRQAIAIADWAVRQTQPDETIYLIYQGDDGYHWFEYSCRLLPRILVYGDGGVSYGLAEYGTGRLYRALTAEEFLAETCASGAAWLLVAQSDEIFAASYAALFGDGLAAPSGGAAALYRVGSTGFALAAVWEEGSA